MEREIGNDLQKEICGYRSEIISTLKKILGKHWAISKDVFVQKARQNQTHFYEFEKITVLDENGIILKGYEVAKSVIPVEEKGMVREQVDYYFFADDGCDLDQLNYRDVNKKPLSERHEFYSKFALEMKILTHESSPPWCNSRN